MGTIPCRATRFAATAASPECQRSSSGVTFPKISNRQLESFSITVTDTNEASVGAISDANASANTLAENAIAGTAVGITASASDPDAGDSVSYSLDDDAGGRFAMAAEKPPLFSAMGTSGSLDKAAALKAAAAGYGGMPPPQQQQQGGYYPPAQQQQQQGGYYPPAQQGGPNAYPPQPVFGGGGGPTGGGSTLFRGLF